MGVQAADWWSVVHFLYGVMATMAIAPRHPGIGILVGNMIHAYGEALEKNYRKGDLVESDKNHAGDIVAFLLGSFIGVYFTPITINYPVIRWVILIWLILSTVQEFGREIWAEKWPFDAANKPFHWFGTVTALVKDEKK
jgi:hypothetical protein